MKHSIQKTFLILIIIFTVFFSSKGQTSGIEVGTRTSDSTAQLTLSLQLIQQNIIPSLPSLSGITFSSTQPILFVTQISAYIILSGTNTSAQPVTVAIELISDQTKLMFQPHKNTAVHLCKKTSACSACEFIQMGSMIVTCKCVSESIGPEAQQICRDNITISK